MIFKLIRPEYLKYTSVKLCKAEIHLIVSHFAKIYEIWLWVSILYFKQKGRGGGGGGGEKRFTKKINRLWVNTWLAVSYGLIGLISYY